MVEVAKIGLEFIIVFFILYIGMYLFSFKKLKNYNRNKMSSDLKYLVYKYKIDVSNEARMHIWKKKNYNIDALPYINCEDAIKSWTATVSSIGITIKNNKLKIYAPYGLSDIFSKTIRPIKHKYNTKEIYYQKVKSWRNRFNNLTIIDW